MIAEEDGPRGWMAGPLPNRQPAREKDAEEMQIRSSHTAINTGKSEDGVETTGGHFESRMVH